MKKLSFVTRILAFVACLSLLTTVAPVSHAAEPTIGDTHVISNEKDIQPRGSLSGYGSQYTNYQYGGSFTFQVNGSWSPWAGCTVRFTGFPDNTYVTYKLEDLTSGRQYFDRGFTITSSSQGDEGDHNIAMANVSPGTYRLTWNVYSSVNGLIHCHVY